MPRVYTKTKSTRGRVYRCESCGQDIEPGSQYYEWSRRFGRSGRTYRQHATCGRPRPTQLSSRKTARIDEAINEAESQLSNFGYTIEDYPENGGTIEIDVSDLEGILNDIAECAREVGEEYQESFDNLPENFQSGSVGEAMESVAQELESWADEVESTDLDGEVEVEAFEPDEELDGEELAEARAAWESDVDEAVEAKLDELRTAVSDAISDYPQYEG